MLSASGRWSRLPSGLAALAYRDYRLIWTGQVISNVGSSMQQLGLGWLIVQLAERDGAPQLVAVHLRLVGPAPRGTVLSSIAQAFDGATRQTVYPRLVPRRAMVSAIGLNSMAFNVAQFIGPMIGGFLIGAIWGGGLVLLNALSFAALIYAIFIQGPLPSHNDGRPRVSPLRSLQESFAFVVR